MGVAGPIFQSEETKFIKIKRNLPKSTLGQPRLIKHWSNWHNYKTDKWFTEITSLGIIIFKK